MADDLPETRPPRARAGEAAATPAASAKPAAAAALAEGVTIDRYRLESCIGSGGYGEVWRAIDRDLERTVAIKLVHGRLASEPGISDRFMAEARAASKLIDPAIAQVFDFGIHGDRPYYVMELLDGESLDQRLASAPDHRLSPGDAVPIARGIARGLALMHGRGLVHRDVKPSNVFVCKDGRVALLDLGLVKAAGGEPGAETAIGLGSASYMSPEQCRGDAIGAASDLYSFGATLFEMVTGAPPFRGTAAVVTMHHMEEPAPRASERVATLPAAIDDLLASCLAKAPADRPADATAIADALTAAVAVGGSPTPPTPSSPRRRRTRTRSRTSATIAAIVLAVAAVAALAVIAIDRAGTKSPPALLQVPIVDAAAERVTLAGIVRDDRGQPVADASVDLPACDVAVVPVQASGAFTLTDVPRLCLARGTQLRVVWRGKLFTQLIDLTDLGTSIEVTIVRLLRVTRRSGSAPVFTVQLDDDSGAPPGGAAMVGDGLFIARRDGRNGILIIAAIPDEPVAIAPATAAQRGAVLAKLSRDDIIKIDSLVPEVRDELASRLRVRYRDLFGQALQNHDCPRIRSIANRLKTLDPAAIADREAASRSVGCAAH